MICLNQNLNFEFPLCKSNFIYKKKGQAPDVFISKENVLFASFQYPGTNIFFDCNMSFYVWRLM